MTDLQLLDRFVRRDDRASFEALVERHGPRVRRVCRQVLADTHDVDDAYQATLVVLARKAPAIRDPGALGNWLHGVAYRVASRLRRDAARRRLHERRCAEMGPPPGAVSRPWADLVPVVRDELALLPDAYRVPLELCFLRGYNHERAAAELGWPLGTLKTRVRRGRERLRERLGRRGIALGVGLPLLLLRRREAGAATPGTSRGPASSRDPPPIGTAPAPVPAGVGPGISARATWSRWDLIRIALIALAVLFAASRVIAFLASSPAVDC